ncbi:MULTISPECIES: GTP-binding protein [Prochlorococcus]|uniref:GTP-binding protein n=1 Tax=Prochlorococcus TaxID=1218 RepID=UPI00056AAEE9|nr:MULTISPECIES: GTP-binding protein [Prochlorococcus]
MQERLPVTVVTGFLGAGKTTLLRNLLQKSGLKLAVVVNEFGSVGIDGDLIKSCGFCPEEEIEDRLVELNNGCLCCTVQDDFLPTMEKLIARSQNLDGIIIETSGLALPRPLLQALEWPEIKTSLFVNGVVTLVDSEALSLGSPIGDLCSFEKQRNEDKSLEHITPVNELFHDQLKSADLVLLSRADLVSSETIKAITKSITSYVRDGTAILPISQGDIQPSLIIGLSKRLSVSQPFRSNSENSHHDHNHIDVISDSLRFESEIDQLDIKEALVKISMKYQILRLKGRFWLSGKILPLQVQMVGPRFHAWFEDAPPNTWKPKNGGADLIVLSLKQGASEAIYNFFN